MLPLLTLLLACPPEDPPGGDTGGPDDTGPTWPPSAEGVVELATRDGLTLQAELRHASGPGRPAVVLLHMIPPANDRSNWPEAFLQALEAQDWGVLNIDRRGAGGSEGEPTDAYEGELGRYDVEAAVLRLQADGYGPVGIMGASNGTTSMIDYTAWAGGEGLPEPAVLGFLTGGLYTENQTPMSAITPWPCVFTTQTSENAWTEAQRALDPGTWTFHEYLGAGHGTQMLESEAAAQVTADLVGDFAAVLGP